MEQGDVLAARARVDHGPPVLVVIGGLPGSGKTTLLRRWLAEEVPGVTGLDSEFVTERFRRAGIGIPYRFLRPWVHVVHRWLVVRALRSDDPVVVLTDPWTGERWRAAVLRAATRAGRTVRLVVVEASPEEAAGGQSARGRTLSGRAMRRHVDRAERFRGSAAAVDIAAVPLVVDRRRAGSLTVAEVLGRSPT